MKHTPNFSQEERFHCRTKGSFGYSVVSCHHCVNGWITEYNVKPFGIHWLEEVLYHLPFKYTLIYSASLLAAMVRKCIQKTMYFFSILINLRQNQKHAHIFVLCVIDSGIGWLWFQYNDCQGKISWIQHLWLFCVQFRC